MPDHFVHPRPNRMRDSRYLTGELSDVPEEVDLYGRRFAPRHFRATWERQGGPECPWELRVTVQGPALLKNGRRGETVRSLVYEDETAEVVSATFRRIPAYLLRALAEYAPQAANYDAGV